MKDGFEHDINGISLIYTSDFQLMYDPKVTHRQPVFDRLETTYWFGIVLSGGTSILASCHPVERGAVL